MRLRSTEGDDHDFIVFIRQSLEFSEDFSFGLIYSSNDGKKFILIRYNGQHDQTNDPMNDNNPHFQYHIHKATADNVNSGMYGKLPAKATPDYASFSAAASAFLTKIGLPEKEIARYFPGMEGLPLFSMLDDPK